MTFNTALADARIDNLVTAGLNGNRLTLTTAAVGTDASLQLAADDHDPAVTQLGFGETQENTGGEALASSVVFTGLTVDNPEDQDWYAFRLADNPDPDARLVLTSGSPIDGLGLTIYEVLDGGGLVPVTRNQDQLDLKGTNSTPADAWVINNITDVSRLTGLTIHDSLDVDYFRFELPSDATDSDQLGLLASGIGEGESVTFQLLGADGQTILQEITADTDSPAAILELLDDNGDLLTATVNGESYFIRVATTSGPAGYQLFPSIGPEVSNTIDLSAGDSGEISLAALNPDTQYLLQVTSPNQVPTIYDLAFELNDATPAGISLAARQGPVVRRDVILGGPGNDVLAGGPGEDWVFGGPGNDVLTGGQDRQASDLLFGNEGDDIFQLIPDDLPLLLNSDETFVPTFNDRFNGGDGDDQVLFLGGDTDRLGQPVPDFVSIRYNTILHRYEFTSLVWDVTAQEFVGGDAAPATLLAGQDLENFDLGGDATFDLTVNGETATVFVPHEGLNGTSDNADISDLVSDLNAALTAASVDDRVVARFDGARIVLSTIAAGANQSLGIGFETNQSRCGPRFRHTARRRPAASHRQPIRPGCR